MRSVPQAYEHKGKAPTIEQCMEQCNAVIRILGSVILSAFNQLDIRGESTVMSVSFLFSDFILVHLKVQNLVYHVNKHLSDFRCLQRV